MKEKTWLSRREVAHLMGVQYETLSKVYWQNKLATFEKKLFKGQEKFNRLDIIQYKQEELWNKQVILFLQRMERYLKQNGIKFVSIASRALNIQYVSLYSILKNGKNSSGFALPLLKFIEAKYYNILLKEDKETLKNLLKGASINLTNKTCMLEKSVKIVCEKPFGIIVKSHTYTYKDLTSLVQEGLKANKKTIIQTLDDYIEVEFIDK